MLAGLSPARRRLFLAVAVLVVVAVAALAVVLVSRAAAPAAEPVSQERPGPVLLVPGYGGSTGSLQSLADRLTAAGRDATVVPLPGAGTGDLAEAAAALAVAADVALARTGAESVDVVGYSAGGVVARLWIADGGAEVTRRVVTLGSPHHGTTLADLAGDVAPERVPARLPAAGHRLRRAGPAERRRRDARGPDLGVDLDDAGPHGHPAGVRPPRRRAEPAGAVGVRAGPARARRPAAQRHRPGDRAARTRPGEPVALDAADCARLGG